MPVGEHIVRRFVTSLTLSAAVCLAGCAHSSSGTARQGADAGALKTHLATLAPTVRQDEAGRVAFRAYDYSLQLAREYRVVRPAALHNILVNIGVRQRGLCYEWAEDLLAELQALDPVSLQLRWGVARAGTFREHNCVVVTARNQPFDQGVVLDAWRRSGRLVWRPVAADKYPWVEVESIPPP